MTYEELVVFVRKVSDTEDSFYELDVKSYVASAIAAMKIAGISTEKYLDNDEIDEYRLELFKNCVVNSVMISLNRDTASKTTFSLYNNQLLILRDSEVLL